MPKVLIAYATKYGSTKEVAEAVADVLREQGLDAEVHAAGDVSDVGAYSAVVVGGALYYFRWHGDARKLLKRNRKALADKPVALFGLGPFSTDPQELVDARKPIDKFVESTDWLSPKVVGIFGGQLQPDKLRFPDANPAMKNMEPSDSRDWDVIRSWAAELPSALGIE